MAREVPLARRAWEVLGQLEVDADTINVERHLPSQFQMGPPKFEAEIFNHGFANSYGTSEQRSTEGPNHTFLPARYTPSPVSPGRNHSISQVLASPNTAIEFFQATDALRPEQSRRGSTTYVGSVEQDHALENIISPQPSPATPAGRKPSSQESIPRRKSEAPTEKGKSKWRFGFASSKKPPIGASGDSSSLSSSALENQRLEEISLSSLIGGQKSSQRSKHHKAINACLSQSSSLALFWTQLCIQVWDIEPCPPSMTRVISTESTCILATVAKSLLAYVIGTRDQKLTVRQTLHAVLCGHALID